MMIRLGTRGSQLALTQSHMVKQALLASTDLEEEAIEIVTITTSGDKFQETPLHKIGGKALFAKEIEQALFDQSIDIAVHSAKDLPAILPQGLMISATLPRTDPRDAWVSSYRNFDVLPQGARIGTSSPRRAAYMLSARPDIEILPFRGNLPTRMQKLKDGIVDGTFLAMAGLDRLGIESELIHPLPIDQFIPAASQGVIAIECLENNIKVQDLLEKINDEASFHAITAERAFQEKINGDCTTPLAAYATIHDGTITLRAAYLLPPPTPHAKATLTGTISDARNLGLACGEEVLRQLS